MKTEFNINLDKLPVCPKCKEGDLLPFTDYTPEGAFYLKGWACSNCGHNIFFKSGSLVHMIIEQLTKQ